MEHETVLFINNAARSILCKHILWVHFFLGNDQRFSSIPDASIHSVCLWSIAAKFIKSFHEWMKYYLCFTWLTAWGSICPIWLFAEFVFRASHGAFINIAFWWFYCKWNSIQPFFIRQVFNIFVWKRLSTVGISSTTDYFSQRFGRYKER